MTMRPNAIVSTTARAGAKCDETTARRSRAAVAILLVLATSLAGCSSRPYSDLLVGAPAPGTSTVDLLVATTRAPVLEPPGVMFGGARGKGLDFADIVV